MSSNHAYLTLNEGLQSIKLDSSQVLTETSITDSFVQVDVDKYSFQINVLVDIFECRVDTLGFEKEFLSTDYTIGLGLHQVSLPEIVQKPDCGKSINGLKIKDIVAKETISGYAKQAIRLDTDIASLLIKTGKFTLAGESIKVIVSIEQSIVSKATDLEVEVNFVAEKPNFDLSNFKIKPIVCCINKLISWQMELPPLTGSDPEAISVEIVKS